VRTASHPAKGLRSVWQALHTEVQGTPWLCRGQPWAPLESGPLPPPAGWVPGHVPHRLEGGKRLKV
jgi:hypothetical protein